MNKILKRLLTGVLTLATVFTALPTTAVHAAETQYWTESEERVGIVEKVMNDGSIGSTFNEGHMTVEGEDAYCIDINTGFVMGWNTYHQIVTELSPEDWVYDDFTTYVVTHKQKKSSDKIHFVNKNPVELIKELRKENGNGIWICGGANLIQQLVRADIIDCYYITVIPTILGSGIRLFEKADHEIKLRLLKTQSYNGMMDLIYAKR